MQRVGKEAPEELAQLGAHAGQVSAWVWASRYFRAAAYEPLLRGDARSCLQALDRAWSHGVAAKPAQKWDDIVRSENFYPILETRLKSLVQFGQLDEAAL